MNKYKKCKFYNTDSLHPTVDIELRCNSEYIQTELKKNLPNESFHVDSVKVFKDGKYQKNFLTKINDLPPFVEVRITHSTGLKSDIIIVWSPLAWNDRFAGTGGGGTGIGGDVYIKKPSNTDRGWNMSYALLNGFSTATADACNVDRLNDKIFDKKTGEFNWDIYENWRARTTHDMTMFGKAVSEVLHKRKVKYSYYSGGSGGGRQALVEAQEFPTDYDGIWASCPAINWTRFLAVGLWPYAVFNEYNHVPTPKVMKLVNNEVHKSVGGSDRFFSMTDRVEFDLQPLVDSKKITELDQKVILKLWDGPRDQAGNKLWYFYRPGTQYWLVGLPVGGFYYSLIGHKPRLFIVVLMYMRWVVGNKNEKFKHITISDFEELFLQSTKKFPTGGADNPDLSAFNAHGGKLLIDHGTDDPLIPGEGTIDYINNVRKLLGDKAVGNFLRFYFNPGDGHGNCHGHGAGFTQSTGISALMNWVEHGEAPDELPAVRLNQISGRVIKAEIKKPYKVREL